MRYGKRVVRLLTSQHQEEACIRVADRLIDLFLAKVDTSPLEVLREERRDIEIEVHMLEVRLSEDPRDFIWVHHRLIVARGKLHMATCRVRRLERKKARYQYLLDTANHWLDNSAL